MLGVPCEIEKVKLICQKHGLYLIEDTAWGCGGSLNNQFLGTWGDIGTFSFDFAKTITTGEGGMLIAQDKNIFEKQQLGMITVTKTIPTFQGGKIQDQVLASTTE